MPHKRTSMISHPQRRNNSKADANSSSTWTRKLVRWIPWPNKIFMAEPHERKCSGADDKTASRFKHSDSPQIEEPEPRVRSMEDLQSPMIWISLSKDLEKSIQESSKFSEKLSLCRTELRFVQSQQGYEMEKARSKLHFLDESIRAVAMSPQARVQCPLQQSTNDTAISINRLAEDWKDFLDHWKVIVHFENVVNTKQTQVARFETKVLSSIKSLLIHLPKGEAAVRQSQALDDRDTASSISETVPETARRLFENFGQLATLEEELERLDFNHFDEQQRRDFNREQDKEPEITDPEFEARYVVERRDLETEIEKMHAAMASLRLQCEQENIDISRFGLQQDRTSEHQIPYEENHHVDNHQAMLHPQDRDSETEGPKNDSAVEGWLEEVESDGESMI